MLGHVKAPMQSAGAMETYLHILGRDGGGLGKKDIG